MSEIKTQSVATVSLPVEKVEQLKRFLATRSVSPNTTEGVLVQMPDGRFSIRQFTAFEAALNKVGIVSADTIKPLWFDRHEYDEAGNVVRTEPGVLRALVVNVVTERADNGKKVTLQIRAVQSSSQPTTRARIYVSEVGAKKTGSTFRGTYTEKGKPAYEVPAPQVMEEAAVEAAVAGALSF